MNCLLSFDFTDAELLLNRGVTGAVKCDGVAVYAATMFFDFSSARYADVKDRHLLRVMLIIAV